MGNNLPTEQNRKRKIISWILGFIGVALAGFGWTFFLYLIPESIYYAIPGKSWFDVMFLYFLIPLILSIVGIIIGIKQRMAAGRLSSILGIIIPIIAIVLILYFAFTVELSIFARTT